MGRQTERMPMLSSTIVQMLTGTSDPGELLVLRLLLSALVGGRLELVSYLQLGSEWERS